jgi:4-hydroxybenzoate polyprenyltransferase
MIGCYRLDTTPRDLRQCATRGLGPGATFKGILRDQPLSTPSRSVVFDAASEGASPALHRVVETLERAVPGSSPVFNLLRLYRAPQWLHMLPVPLATFDSSVPLATALLAAGRGVANAFAILAFGFLLNAVSDLHVDRDARKNPLLLPGHGGYKTSLIVLPAVSLALAAFSPWPVQLATAWCLTLGCVYSIGPRLKAIPVVGTVTDAAGFTPILFLGMAGSSLPPGFGTVAIAFAALLLQNQLIHEAGDRVEDEASGIRTTWLALGPRWTALLTAAAGALATGATASTVAPFGYSAVSAVVGAALVVAFPLLLAWQGLSADGAARLRVVHRWCAVLVGAMLYVAWRHAV